MVKDNLIPLDVGIIGGGPSGISACLELSKGPGLKIALFERNAELGGVPRSCHMYFGMRDLRRIMTGPEYARRLNSLIRRTSVDIHTESTVIDILPNGSDKGHRIDVLSPDGLLSYGCNVILLTTGCYEISRCARMIPGTRTEGIYTTGTLQEIANIRKQKAGSRAVIIGSEHIALSSVLTLRRSGLSIAGMIEEDPKLHTFSTASRAMSIFFDFPVFSHTSILSVFGDDRVEGVKLLNNKDKKPFELKCDTVIVTGKFQPYSLLIDSTPIRMDPATSGPVIDTNFMTSVQNIYAAGNVLRGANMHDLCALEGKEAAANILRGLEYTGDNGDKGNKDFYLRAESPIRYVVPQKILPDRIKAKLLPNLVPGCSIQVAHSMDKPVIEAWSADRLIWRKSYRRLIANHRIPIPLWKFDLKHVNEREGVILTLHDNH